MGSAARSNGLSRRRPGARRDRGAGAAPVANLARALWLSVVAGTMWR
jgi:hypothetical protein